MSVIRANVSYPGVWHGDGASFSIQNVTPAQGSEILVGTAQLLSGPHKGAQFTFAGIVDKWGGLTIKRVVAGGEQTGTNVVNSWTNPHPQAVNGEFIWSGSTTGPGITGSLPFEMRVPLPVRKGKFAGTWHGDPVDYIIHTLHNTPNPNGVAGFDGVATFTGGAHQGIQFGITGSVDVWTSLGVRRDLAIGWQAGNDPRADLVAGEWVWKGQTKGAGIPASGLPFAMKMPA